LEEYIYTSIPAAGRFLALTVLNTDTSQPTV
jgi:hypothetical protein